MSKRAVQIVLGIVALAAVVTLAVVLSPPKREIPTISLLTLADDLKAGTIEQITIESGGGLQVRYADGGEARAQKEPESTLVEQLAALGVTQRDLGSTDIVMSDASSNKQLSTILAGVLQLIVIGVLVFIVFTKAPSFADSSAFGKNKNPSQVVNRPTVTFGDVAGVDEAKEELQEVVSFLREPQQFAGIGARTPKGVLLVGPPGTGKTLLAKAIAGESQVPFFNMSGSEFVEMFVGVGASRVRKLFAQAKKHSPSIVFIDEIDAVGRHRDVAVTSNNSEREQTLNQILVEIDGFSSDTGVIVVAATNRSDVLDPALLRPGRFDRQVTLSPPDIKGREETFLVHLKGKAVDKKVSAWDLARATPGFVGADIENVVNEAAILAVRRGKTTIGMEEFDAAIERVMAGPEKRGRIISEHERQVVAYHEVGHALVARLLPQCDPVKKVSLIGRGAAAGYTITMPEQDRYLVGSGKLKDDLAFILGGRAAEEIVFDEVTTGASNDLMKATDMARSMVVRYGMSEKIGPLCYAGGPHHAFEQDRVCSEAKAEEIDAEIKRFVEEAYERARSLLRQHRQTMQRIVDALMAEETLDAERFEEVFQGARLVA